MIKLSEIKAEVDQLASRIGADRDVLPTFGCSENGARPHIEVDSHGYHLVVVERGQELERLTTNDLDELLFKVFQAVTFDLACAYGMAHHVENQDFRRILFPRQVKLLTTLSPHWGERESQNHEQILRQHPFTDQLTC